MKMTIENQLAAKQEPGVEALTHEERLDAMEARVDWDQVGHLCYHAICTMRRRRGNHVQKEEVLLDWLERY